MLGKFAFTNKRVSEKLNINEEKVALVMEFFSTELNREMVECNHAFLFVRGLGTFGMSLMTIEKRLKTMIKLYIASDKNTKFAKGYRNEVFNLLRMRKIVSDRREENKQLRDVSKD